MIRSDPASVLAKFNYTFPTHLIANKPAAPRDSARLLVYDRASGERFFDTFLNLDTYVPSNAVLVFNETKVIPARLRVRKPTGGEARMLYLGVEKNYWKVLSDRKLAVGSRVHVTKSVFFDVIRHEGNMYFLKPSFGEGEAEAVFMKYGQTPIPPYIKGTSLRESELRRKYQTVFAKTSGSVAAPTASLHFTNRLISKLKKRGIKIVYVTLHVNLGTFAFLTEKEITSGKLHREFYEISGKSAEILNRSKQEGREVIAVGTTVVRTLESAADSYGKIKVLRGDTDLFIRDGYKMKFVDQLITNFHVPKSSLIILVSQFVERRKLLALYAEAIQKNFRFFSFGDGMYVR